MEEALTIKNTDIAKELCLPPVKLHCSSECARMPGSFHLFRLLAAVPQGGRAAEAGSSSTTLCSTLPSLPLLSLSVSAMPEAAVPCPVLPMRSLAPRSLQSNLMPSHPLKPAPESRSETSP